jgi:hypothetical protein
MMTRTYRPTLASLNIKPTKAEQKLLECSASNKHVSFGVAVPDRPTDQNIIRAEILRFLLLGGSKKHPIGQRGIQVRGAWIEGEFDFSTCKTSLEFSADRCRFTQPISLQDASLGALRLTGCHSVELYGQNLKVLRDVFLSEGLISTGPVTLSGSKIGGQFNCTGGRFEFKHGTSLDCARIQVGESVFLRHGFSAAGQVNLHGAKIGGQFSCNGGKFLAASGNALDCQYIVVAESVFLNDSFSANGAVMFHSANIAGSFYCAGGWFEDELSLFQAAIRGKFSFQELRLSPVSVNLEGAFVGDLDDTLDSWETLVTLHITGFEYQRISSIMSKSDRLKWLDMNSSDFIIDDKKSNLLGYPVTKDIASQPYTYRARLYQEHGDRLEAAQIRYEREKRLRKGQYARIRLAMVEQWNWRFAWIALKAELRRVFDAGFGAFFGYGHKPTRAVGAFTCIWVFTVCLYSFTYSKGQMAPNSDVILTSNDWQAAVTISASGVIPHNARCAMPLCIWELTPTFQDYETFNRYAYALDLFIPLDSLGQEAAWAPSKDRGSLGAFAYWLRWPIQIAGWIITAVGAATLTGLVGRKE